MSGWAIDEVKILPVNKKFIIFEIKHGVEDNSPTFGDSDWSLDIQMLRGSAQV